jgi:hypothetical protein
MHLLIQQRQDEQGLISDKGELFPIPSLNGGTLSVSERHKFCLDEDGILICGQFRT